jgi:acyl carrier protein
MQHDIIDSGTRVQAWMVAYLADLMDIPQEEVDVTLPFDQYGLDSAATVAFTSDLGHWLDTKLDSRLMVEHDTIGSVAAHVGQVHSSVVPA